jgi:hypothetical protein
MCQVRREHPGRGKLQGHIYQPSTLLHARRLWNVRKKRIGRVSQIQIRMTQIPIRMTPFVKPNEGLPYLVLLESYQVGTVQRTGTVQQIQA